MKKILIALFIVFIISSCSLIPNIGSAEKPGSTDNPGTTNPDTPSTTPGSPSTPSTNIPNIPGAPDINTDQEFVSNYVSLTEEYGEPVAGGPTGIATDIMSVFMDSFSTLLDVWYEKTGESLVDYTIPSHNESLTLKSGLDCHFVSGMRSDNMPYVNAEFSYNRYTISNNLQTFTCWGTMYSELGPNSEGLTTCKNSNMSIIADVNGQRFSFVSTDFNFDGTVLSGTAYINGNLCYFTFTTPESDNGEIEYNPPIIVDTP